MQYNVAAALGLLLHHIVRHMPSSGLHPCREMPCSGSCINDPVSKLPPLGICCSGSVAAASKLVRNNPHTHATHRLLLLLLLQWGTLPRPNLGPAYGTCASCIYLRPYWECSSR